MENSKSNGSEMHMRHKTTYSEKRNKSWYIPVIDYYINLGNSLNNKTTTQDNLNASQAIVKDDVYKEVLNQINAKNMEVEIRELNILDDVDIITPIKERYMGEFVRTPGYYSVSVESEDITIALNHAVQERIFAILVAKLKERLKTIQSEIIEAGAQDEDAINEQMAKIDIKSEVKLIKEEFFTREASKAKNIVDYIVKNARVEEQLYQMFYYFFSCEEVYVEVDPAINNISIEVLSPLEYYRIPSDGSMYVEDDSAGFIKKSVHIAEILDKFDSELSDNDKTYLEGLLGRTETGPLSLTTEQIMSRDINRGELGGSIKSRLATQNEVVFANNAESVEEHKVYFTTKRKVGHLTYIGASGLEETTIVGDTYKIDKAHGDIKLDWSWADEIWVGYRYGGASGDGVYIAPKPILIQRDELGVEHTCKIPVIGVSNILKDYGRKPIPARMLSHQAMYTILTNKLNREVAKFQGFVNLIPESILSESNDFSQAERLEYMYKDNMLIFNDSEVDVNTLQAMRTVGNSGQADYIRVIREIRDGIKAEAWDMANMNQERYGSIDTKGGMANTQEAIRRISTGSVMMFTAFDMFREHFYQALSDYGRVVYVNGISTGFMSKAGELVELDLNHETLISSQMGINFTTNAIEREKMETIRNAMIQSGIQSGKTLDAIEAIKTDDLESLKIRAKQLQDAAQQREDQLVKQQQETDKYIADKKEAAEKAKLDNSIQQVETKGDYDLILKDKDIYIKLLELKAQQQLVESGNDSNGNGIPDRGYTKLDENIAYIEAEIKRENLKLIQAKVSNERRKPVKTK